jgi:hypothetical protein
VSHTLALSVPSPRGRKRTSAVGAVATLARRAPVLASSNTAPDSLATQSSAPPGA